MANSPSPPRDVKNEWSPNILQHPVWETLLAPISQIQMVFFIFSDLILNVENLETGARPKTVDAGRDLDVESGLQGSGPRITLERSATLVPEGEIKCVSEAKFDPKGKSVASGKNISGWL